MHFVKRLIVVAGLVLALTACGGGSKDHTAGSDGLSESVEFASALAQVPQKARRVAIVHSQSTKAAFYDAFAYNQLFASVQNQSMMAGVPFDLLDETALATTADLLKYDAIIIPGFTHVKATDRQTIKTRLLQAQNNGVGIIAAGELMIQKPDGGYYTDLESVMVEVLGVRPTDYFDDVRASVRVLDNTHPVGRGYEVDEELTAYERFWFGNFEPVQGEQSTPLTIIKARRGTYTGAQIIERSGRVIHFANDQVMADNNQLWRAIQWAVYGDVAPVSLQVSRSDHVFLARNDMDVAMIAADLSRTEIPLLEILKSWKRDYNFVGSFYIDIGNDPAAGEYTDWGVSGPLYQDYMALGNEIATHSWTHPHRTSRLTTAQLEFEFKDSAAEIGSRLGVPVVGAAVPGMDESLAVVETLNPWFDYLSGRTGKVGTGYPGAFGFLEPQHTMMYFSLNMIPDYESIDYLGNTPDQTKAIWKSEIDTVLKHAQQPIVHWLWHDYGPTTQTDAGLYNKEMFVETVAYAKSLGAEFVTLQDMHSRIRKFAAADLSVGSSNVVTANVTAAGVGQFALKVSEDAKIKSVANWYAYDEDQVFLPEAGGQFEISVGPVADDVTRISKLPMRAKLLALTGDGNNLSFTMQGEGEVNVLLSAGTIQNTTVTGADSYTENDGVLTLNFDSLSTHTVEIAAVNTAPVAISGSVNTEPGAQQPIILEATDADGDALSYVIQTQPANGTLSGTVPSLTYVSNQGYVGTDSFTFLVSDGRWSSAPVEININVVAPPIPLPEKPVVLSPANVTQVLANEPITVKFTGVGQAISNYQIQRFDRTLLRWTYVRQHDSESICTGNECSVAVAGLAPQAYTAWRVRAKNSQGWGPWSDNAIFSVVSTFVSLPEKPVLQAPINLQTVSANAPVPVVFTAVGVDVTKYQLQRYDRIANRWSYMAIENAADICSSSTCSTTVGSVGPQRYAVWRVRARNIAGWGPWSNNAVFNAL